MKVSIVSIEMVGRDTCSVTARGEGREFNIIVPHMDTLEQVVRAKVQNDMRQYDAQAKLMHEWIGKEIEI